MSETKSPIHVDSNALPWTDYSAWYPADMMRSMRAKRIIGPGGAIDEDGTLFGTLEIDPGGSYPPHRHAAPEVYFVISGQAECVFGDDTFTAGPGSVIRTPPNMVHSFRTLGDEPFRAVAYWWAPPGRAEVLAADLELVEGED